MNPIGPIGPIRLIGPIHTLKAHSKVLAAAAANTAGVETDMPLTPSLNMAAPLPAFRHIPRTRR